MFYISSTFLSSRTQEGAKTSEGVIVDYDKFIIQKINEFPVTLR